MCLTRVGGAVFPHCFCRYKPFFGMLTWTRAVLQAAWVELKEFYADNDAYTVQDNCGDCALCALAWCCGPCIATCLKAVTLRGDAKEWQPSDKELEAFFESEESANYRSSGRLFMYACDCAAMILRRLLRCCDQEPQHRHGTRDPPPCGHQDLRVDQAHQAHPLQG